MQIRCCYKHVWFSRLMLSLFCLFIVSQPAFTQSPAGEQPSDMEVLRDRFTGELLAPEVNEEEIRDLVASIRGDGSWPDINYKDTSRTAFEHSRHLSNMVELGRAYKKPGSAYHGDPEVKEAVHSSLDFWLKHDFICENWWWNQIGTPERIGNLLLIMDEELSDEQKRKADPIVGRANLDAWGARPGGDLIKIAGILGKHGIFKRDHNILDEALNAIAGEIGFAVKRGDTSDMRGLQTDFSFHHRHDRVTSTLTYGQGFAGYFVDWAEKVRGTSFRFPDRAIELMVDFYLDGICKAMAYGRYPDPGAKNRGITRRGALTPYSAEVPEKLLRVTSYRENELETIARIRRGEEEPGLRSSRFFWHTEYYSHQRPDYFASVRMYSLRNHNMEVPYNGEGLKNHHLGDGYTFITRTGDEYTHIFPVWDWQKVPGTTVLQKPSLPDPGEVQQAGLTAFVGGVTDGLYGAAAFDFESPIDPLSARKSWFFFDDEIVSIGAGITSDSEHPVATTLNQSLLKGKVVSGSGGESGEEVHPRGTHALREIDWVHHDKTAYLFPEPVELYLENSRRSGSWYDINNQIWAKRLGEVQKDVFTLWLDHGVAPGQVGYAYIVVPGIEAAEVEEYRERSAVNILTNTSRIQAVRHGELNISQVVFYEAGEIQIAEGVRLSVDHPGMVMVKTSGGRVKEITVSDPGRQQDSFRLQVTARFEDGDNKRAKVTWNEEEGYSVIEVELPDGEYAGQSVTVK